MPPQCTCYGAYDGERIVAFIGIIHFPHPRNKKIKKVSRLVVLPDYQGIGIGKKFLEIIGTFYRNQGFDFAITTSAKNLIMSLKNDKNWICSRYDVTKNNSTIKKGFEKSLRLNCKTASFYFK